VGSTQKPGALIAVVNLYGPGLQHVFATAPIPGMFWGLPFCFALGVLIVDEVRKLMVRTYPKVRRMGCLQTSPFPHTALSYSLLLPKWPGRVRAGKALSLHLERNVYHLTIAGIVGVYEHLTGRRRRRRDSYGTYFKHEIGVMVGALLCPQPGT
jgi:hypothetical protein